jgi:hypothetical protein
VSRLWRWMRRVPSLLPFGLFVLLWLPTRCLPEHPPRLAALVLRPYAALTMALLVLSDRIDRLLVPEAYRTLWGDEPEVPYP